MVEVKTTVSAHTAVVGASGFKGRLGRPGEGALVDGKMRQLVNDFVNSNQWVSIVFVHRSNGGGTDLSLLPYVCSVKERGGE